MFGNTTFDWLHHFLDRLFSKKKWRYIVTVRLSSVPSCKNIDIFLLFTKQQNCELVEIESICRQIECDSKTEICFGKGRKHCGKRRKCWLPA